MGVRVIRALMICGGRRGMFGGGDGGIEELKVGVTSSQGQREMGKGRGEMGGRRR